MLLSIGLMVKNEEKYLEQCLKSLVPILEQINSELIIVDTGSTDNTVKIAKTFTDKVYHHEWTNNFSEMRNIVLSYTSGEWFFYLDGDEVLEDPKGVINFFASNKYKKFNCAGMSMNNVFQSDNDDNYGLFHALRFFRNDKDFHFKGIIHEQPQAKGPAAKIDGIITHYGYINDDEELMEYKYKRNVELINKVLEENPEDIYHLFQLSQSYAMYGKYKQALTAIKKAYSIINSKELNRYMYVLTQLAKMYYHDKQYHNSIKIAEEGCKLKEGYLDLYYFQAASYLELGQLEKSIVSFKKYLAYAKRFQEGKGVIDFSVAHTTASNIERTYLALCGIYHKLGNHKEALKYAEMINEPKIIKDAIPHMIEIYIKEEQFKHIGNLLNKWIAKEFLNDSILDSIENLYLNLDNAQRRSIAEILANQETPYGIINTIRTNYFNGINTDIEMVSQVLNEGLDDKKYYYGELLFYLIRCNEPTVQVLSEVKNNTIAGFCQFILHCYEDSYDILINYLNNDSVWDNFAPNNEVNRIRFSLIQSIMQTKKLNDVDYKCLFDDYVKYGIRYINSCYHPEIIEQTRVAWARTNNDAFLFYMYAASKCAKNSADYVRYLRLALRQDESMKRGIELILDEVKAQTTNTELNELEEHKNTILETIKNSINTGDLDLAKTLINEYENIVGLDARICSAKGIVLMVEGNLGEAEKVFLHGLEFEPDNADLLYNMSFLSEVRDTNDQIK